MRAVFCDRCGKLIPPVNATTRIPPVELEVTRTVCLNQGEPMSVIIDLCRDCQKELNDFLSKKSIPSESTENAKNAENKEEQA